ncbi:hypothetical protein SLS62_002115 [Diatrype stigma]|uniref:Initiation-specific alpha-1,6-mannosyltransferase n=1 Tax=Diatrype stigma TaxID=117547 RepID=A0AAN9V0Q2_9PEZI
MMNVQMILQLGNHGYHPKRWRWRNLAVLCLICASVTLTHIILLRPNLYLLYQSQLCTAASTTDTTTTKAASDSGLDSGTGDEPLIPRKIWQIFYSDDLDEGTLVDTTSWLVRNKDYAYTLVGMDGADRFVNEHFADDPELRKTYHALPNFGMKSDLLRYLLLWIEGGVYADIDTTALRPVRDWVPRALRPLVRAVVGIEFDRRDGGGWAEIPHDLQFGQWTLAAAPGHPLFGAMAARALASAAALARDHGTTLPLLRPSNMEVLNATGPAAWTDVVFDHLRREDPRLVSLRNFSFMEEPTLYGDVLVLPIDGFGMGQPHSGSTPDDGEGGTIPDVALVKHHFRGKWRQTDAS